MEKRTVIVTGGNSGLGYQCAKNIAMKDKDLYAGACLQEPGESS